MNRCFVVAAGLSFAAHAASFAADWNQWRGPNRDGLAPESPPLIESLPEAGLRPLWKSDNLPAAKGGGWSSPIVSNGRVYLFAHSKEKVGEVGEKKYPWLPPEKRTGMTDEDYEEYERNRRDEDEARAKAFRFDEIIYCLDAASGELLWTNERNSVYTRFPQSGSPAVVDGRLYVLGAGRQARCLDAAGGTDIWSRDLPGEFRDEHLQSSFVIARGVAIVLCNEVFALDAAGGEILWRTEEDGRTLHSSPVVFDGPSGPLVIVNLPGGETVGLELTTGREKWRIESMAGHSTPLVAGDLLLTYGSSRKGGLRCYRLSDGGAEELWKYQRAADSGASPVVVGDYVFVQGERRLACVNLASGKEEWMTDLDIGNPRYTSLAAADGKVFYAFEGVLCFAADAEGYREVYDARIDKSGLLNETEAFRKELKMDELQRTAEGQKEAERLWREKFNGAGPLPCSSPAIVDGRLFVRLSGGVACYDLGAGS